QAARMTTRLRRLLDLYFFFQAEDGIRDGHVTGVQTCALPILRRRQAPVLRRFRLARLHCQRAGVLAAGSEAPRRFGFCGRATHDLGVSTAVRSRAKAPSPLRSAGALQNLAGPPTVPRKPPFDFRMHWDHEPRTSETAPPRCCRHLAGSAFLRLVCRQDAGSTLGFMEKSRELNWTASSKT